jgi:hypothetical protein
MGVSKSFVMAQIQIGFRTVVGYENLSVLKGIHGPGVHIYIGVELKKGNTKAPALHKRPDGGGGKTLAKRRQNAACDEYEFGLAQSAFPSRINSTENGRF